MKSSVCIGQETETIACHFLQQQGLLFEAKNIRFRFGELDLIMRDGPTLVFVEVKYRSKSNYGSALESITRIKQQRLKRAAMAYRQQQNNYQDCDCRFDVVALSGSITKPSIEWLKNIIF